MKVLVLGSRGTIGRPLVFSLLNRGCSVHEADLQHHMDAEQAYDCYHRCDIGEYRQLAEVFARVLPDVVINLAAEFGRINGAEFTEQVWRTNCTGLRNVIELCKLQCAKLIHISSSEVYGEPNEPDIALPDDPLMEEMAEQIALFPKNDYAVTKLANELMLRNERSIPWICFRIFNAYGPGEWYTPRRSVVAQLVHKALRNEPATVYAECARDFLYIDDLVRTLTKATMRLYSREVYEPKLEHEFINLGGPNYVTIKKLAYLIRERVKVSTAWEWLTTEDGNCKHKRPCNEKARRLLDHECRVDLEMGLDRTIEWQREVYGMKESVSNG